MKKKMMSLVLVIVSLAALLSSALALAASYPYTAIAGKDGANRAPDFPCKTPRSPRRTPSCQVLLVAVLLLAMNISLCDVCFHAHRKDADRLRPLRGRPSSARRPHRRWLSCPRNSYSPPSVRLVDVLPTHYTRSAVEPPQAVTAPVWA